MDDASDTPHGGCAVKVMRTSGRTTALLEGDLEVATACDVEDVLHAELEARPELLEVSLEGLEFLDSAGLRALLVLHRAAQTMSVHVSFVRPQGPVRRTLDFAKALDYLGISD